MTTDIPAAHIKRQHDGNSPLPDAPSALVDDPVYLVDDPGILSGSKVANIESPKVTIKTDRPNTSVKEYN